MFCELYNGAFELDLPLLISETAEPQFRYKQLQLNICMLVVEPIVLKFVKHAKDFGLVPVFHLWPVIDFPQCTNISWKNA